MSRWHRDNPEIYEDLRAEARRQIREEATSPITDHHTFQKLVDERLADLEHDERLGDADA